MTDSPPPAGAESSIEPLSIRTKYIYKYMYISSKRGYFPVGIASEEYDCVATAHFLPPAVAVELWLPSTQMTRF